MNARVTQKDIAKLAGVSQTVVSFVLNERDENLARVPEATRARVLRIIQETGYVADPIARRLKQMGNRMIGVYTYEALFPHDREDFFYPFLAGIEEEAQRLDHDLLLLTSGRAAGRNLGLSTGATRLRLADCCILLGQHMPPEELRFLAGSGFPFVSIGRRDDAGGPISYVAADYQQAVGALVDRARALGHERFLYLGHGAGAESYVDRAKGFDAQAGPDGIHLSPEGEPSEWIRVIRESGSTVVFVEQHEQVEKLLAVLAQQGLAVPSAFSLVTLSGSPDSPEELAGFELPRREMGRLAVSMLSEPGRHERQILLGCRLIPGTSLVPPVRS
jgi:DNA-binding LacI/PurR family transcriptional regulator